ncbi:MAG: nucleotide-binding protein [Acidimicrobiales bacterium]
MSSAPLAMATANVVVVEPDPRRRMALAAKLGEAAEHAMARSISRIASGTGPTVVVFGPSFADATGLAEIETFLNASRHATGVLAAYETSAALLRQAMRAGIVDVVAIPDGLGELADVVHHAATRLANVGRPDHEAPDTTPSRPGKVTVVFGTKGGSGKSFVATNLAIVLARGSERPVALIDADLQFGDAAVMLKLSPEHTIADAVGVMDHLDAPLLRSFFTRYEPSGLMVLPAPMEPALADQISPQDVNRIVALTRSFCAHVVVDTPAYFTDVVLGLLDNADEILLVAGMDVPNIKNVKLGLNTMHLVDIPDYKIKLILNRTKSKAKMDVGDVERVLGRKADALVPSDIIVPQSINEGVPAVLSAPRSEVARGIEAIARLVSIPRLAAAAQR